MLPILVQPNGARWAKRSSGSPLISCNAQCNYVYSNPIKISTTGLSPILGNGLCLRRLFFFGLQSITLMFPVTRFTVYAFILTLALPSNDSNSIWTGIVYSASLCPFKTFTESCSTGPFNHRHVLVLASSKSALTIIFRFHLFKTTGIVRKTISLMGLYYFESFAHVQLALIALLLLLVVFVRHCFCFVYLLS